MKNIQKLKFRSVTRAFSSVIVGLPQVALCLVLAATLVAMLPASSQAAHLSFNQNVTPDVIMGDGIANGGFTVDRSNGVEVGLRGKLRYDSAGDPQNIFNSNGAGAYSFDAGVAPTQSSPTAVWSFEWSINSDYLSVSSG